MEWLAAPLHLEKTEKHPIFPFSSRYMKKRALLFLAFGLSFLASFGQSYQLEIYVNSEKTEGGFTLDKTSRISAKVVGPHTDEAGYVYEFGEVVLSWLEADGEPEIQLLKESQIQENPTLTFAIRTTDIEGLGDEIRMHFGPIKRYDRDKNEEYLQVPEEQAVIRIHRPE